MPDDPVWLERNQLLRQRVRHLERDVRDWKAIGALAFMGGMIVGCVGTIVTLSQTGYFN